TRLKSPFMRRFFPWVFQYSSHSSSKVLLGNLLMSMCLPSATKVRFLSSMVFARVLSVVSVLILTSLPFSSVYRIHQHGESFRLYRPRVFFMLMIFQFPFSFVVVASFPRTP